VITLGFLREISFIQKYIKRELNITLHLLFDLDISLNNNILKLKYNNIPIWHEDISSEDYLLESCDSISRIIYCIDNDKPYEQYLFGLTKS
jgi:hypothetical protein